jgi:hypothetical protein
MKEPSAVPLPPPASTLGGETSTVLRLVAAGLSPEAVAERVSNRYDQRVTTDDVRSVLRYAAALMDDGASLLPPAKAAFVDHFQGVLAFATLTQSKAQDAFADASASFPSFRSARPSTEDLDRLRRLSHRVIRSYLGDCSDFTAFPEAERPEQRSVALQYAEAVLRQAEVIARLNGLGDDAPLQTALPIPDRNRIAEFLLYRNLRGHFETLDSLVAAWQRLVEALKDHPESVGYEEYDDWLTKRDSLEDALSLLSPGTRKDLEARVRQLDERFLEATHATPSVIKPASPWEPERWWWYRIPHRLGKHFQDRLDDLASAS